MKFSFVSILCIDQGDFLVLKKQVNSYIRSGISNSDLLSIVDEAFDLVQVFAEPAAGFEVEHGLLFGLVIEHLHSPVLRV